MKKIIVPNKFDNKKLNSFILSEYPNLNKNTLYGEDMEELTGRIITASGGLYTVATNEGPISCRAKGAFRHEGEKPLSGDMVTLRGSDGEYVVGSILPRKNAFIRPPVANLDLLFTVFSAVSPDPVLLTVDKLISIAEFNGVEPVIVVTKNDLAPDAANQLSEIYRKSGFTVFSCPDGGGIDDLRERISSEYRDKVIAFAGNSGVGKSTLLNALFPSLSLETGRVSVKTERGRHTTRKVELYPLSDLLGDSGASGYIADTPGFSMLDFVRFDFFKKEDLPGTFREFSPYLGQCRYTKCTHTVEEGCAVLEALRRGEVAPSRHESFRALYEDLKNKHDWDKK